MLPIRAPPPAWAVVRARCPSLVGLEGLVVKENTNVFYLVTRADEVKVVPKQGAVFAATVETGASALEATLYGSQLLCRPGERMVRRFKARATIDL